MSAPTETAPQLLQLEHVSKYFGNVLALQDVSLHVNAGEVTCILGDNGAGKSTLIKILSGVHQHDEGAVRVDGEEVRFSSPRDARHAGIALAIRARQPGASAAPMKHDAVSAVLREYGW